MNISHGTSIVLQSCRVCLCNHLSLCLSVSVSPSLSVWCLFLMILIFCQHRERSELFEVFETNGTITAIPANLCGIYNWLRPYPCDVFISCRIGSDGAICLADMWTSLTAPALYYHHDLSVSLSICLYVYVCLSVLFSFVLIHDHINRLPAPWGMCTHWNLLADLAPSVPGRCFYRWKGSSRGCGQRHSAPGNAKL